MLRVIFCGTPQFAVPCLEAVIAAGHTVPLVLAQPDRPVGRGLKVTAPPVKEAALRHGISVLQPEKIKNNTALADQLAACTPDVIVVVAYGRILPPWMLELPPLGCVNVHASLLPKYRGAAPIQWALARGENVTGITTMQMDAGLDTGDMLLQRSLAIQSDWRAPELSAALSALGASLLVETLAALEHNTATRRPQDNTAATLAPLLSREDARISWNAPATEIYNRWRGFYPWPGAATSLNGEPLQIRALRLAPQDLAAAHAPATQAQPGDCALVNQHWLVRCGLGHIEILEAQLPGRRAVPAAQFLAGYGNITGVRLGA